MHSFSVLLHPSTGERGRSIVEATLTEVYDDVVYVDQEESFVEFRAMFAGSDVADDFTAADIPPRFSITGEDAPSERILRTLEALPQVREVVTTPTELEVELAKRRANDPRHDLSIIYLEADSGEVGENEVAELLVGIDGLYFVDQAQTLAEFEAFFEGDPRSIVGQVSTDEMPASWRVDLSCARLDDDLIDQLEANRHVRNVTNAQFSCLENLLRSDT